MIIFSIPRSGSTFISLVAKLLFDDVTVTHHHKSETTAHLLPTDKDPDIIVVRNFLDSAISFYRVHDDNDNRWPDKRPENFVLTAKEQINTVVRIYLPRCEELLKYKDATSLVINYTDIICKIDGKWENNYLRIFSLFEDYFGIKIDDETRQEIIKKTNIAHNKKISDKLQHFNAVDLNTMLHGDHIATGGIGAWKKHVAEDLHEYYSNSLLQSKYDEWLASQQHK